MNRSRVLADLVPPSGWEAIPARAVLTPVTRTGFPEERLLSVSKYKGVHVREDGDSHSRPSDDLNQYLLALPGDLVVNIMLAWDRGLGISTERGLVSPAYATYAVDARRVDSRFLNYQVRSEPAISEWRRRSYGIQPSRWRLYWERMSSARLLMPPLGTQRRIADMLDTETARIDKLIEMNERAIELVDLRTLSMISECVKHGVPTKRPQVVNKYSGSTPAWLLDSVWPIAKLGLLFEVRGGTTPLSTEANWDGPVMWATPVDLRPVHGGSIAETIRTLSTTGANSAGLIQSPPGCIIVSCRAPVGYAAINTVPMTTNQGCKTLVPTTELDARFFRYQLQAFRSELESKGRGSTFAEVSSQALADFPVVVPPVAIQQSVANYLDAETERHSAIRTAILHQQELLRLRRQALITAAVTGQIEV